MALVWKALRCHPAMLIEEPRRTLMTTGFAALAYTLPASGFERLKSWLFATKAPASELARKVLCPRGVAHPWRSGTQ